MLKRTSVIISGIILTLVCLCAIAQELLPLKHIVVFNNNGRKPPDVCVYPLFRLSESFALVEDFYTPATLDATITGNLARSKMLYIGQYCDEGPLFADPQLCEAIRSLLQRGGLLFFDYNTGPDERRFSPDTVTFLKSVGVNPPAEFYPGYGKSTFAETNVNVMLSKPVKIGGKDTGHYGWWEHCSTGQVVLAHDKNAKNKATLILQEGVLGKGAVMFNQLPGVFRDSSGTHFDLVKNILSHVYEEGRSSK
ncbi:MAG: hypothetical protein PHR77_11420 [Kiritimatiellae bacterium]|nr:hypothetical protein [Kiritimatiellia bacterium]MDD5519905.1 hypothetical protein [Kiritimatiellia bacterium]